MSSPSGFSITDLNNFLLLTKSLTENNNFLVFIFSDKLNKLINYVQSNLCGDNYIPSRERNIIAGGLRILFNLVKFNSVIFSEYTEFDNSVPTSPSRNCEYLFILINSFICDSKTEIISENRKKAYRALLFLKHIFYVDSILHKVISTERMILFNHFFSSSDDVLNKMHELGMHCFSYSDNNKIEILINCVKDEFICNLSDYFSALIGLDNLTCKNFLISILGIKYSRPVEVYEE